MLHPLGANAKVLLTSVFGPYAQDDAYGSRKMNPMELYQNQVTRTQGPFSLRMFHRSWGIMLIQANISAPCALLDFPSLERFVQEIRQGGYDIVGITSIMPNLGKVKKMCALIREHLPKAVIVVGGHIAGMPDLASLVDADHVVRGEGVRWFRRYLGEDESRPLRHPLILSGIGARTMGVPLEEKPGDVAATLIPSVGCPMGCNFCATSAMFGGKGQFINFYETGDELFAIMCGLEQAMGVRSFFVMDENFLFHRKRTLRLLELMEQAGKSWSLYVFSSANILRSYTIEQLVRLGISWVWMGLEGKNSRYKKLEGADTLTLVRTLQSHGIRVLGSSIIGLEEHAPEMMDDIIAHAVHHDTDFHQFMLYTPIPGTALHAEHAAKQTLLELKEHEHADIHGQLRFNFRHPHIRGGEEAKMILNAFERDFEVNGPSVVRIARTILTGWKRHKRHADKRVRARYAWEAKGLATVYAGALWAAKRWSRSKPALRQKIGGILRDIHAEFGLKSRLCAPIIGYYLKLSIGREAKRLSKGWTYEPPTFYDMNAGMRALMQSCGPKSELIQHVSASPASL